MKSRNWFNILHPGDNRRGLAAGLAGQDGEGVDRQGLVGRAHSDDWWRLVAHGGHFQVRLSRQRTRHRECRADKEAFILQTDALKGGILSIIQKKLGINQHLDGEAALRGDMEGSVRSSGEHKILISLGS